MNEGNGKLLIIDDNEEFNLAMRMLLSPYFQEVVSETNPEKIASRLESGAYDLILLDMNFRAGMHSGNEGFFWMNKIREKVQDARIIFITGYGEIALAVEAMKKGAADFIEKSWDEPKILSTVLANFRLSRSLHEVERKKEQQLALADSYFAGQRPCYGVSPAMKKIRETIEKAAPTDASILITGESGTGKEVMAMEIHRLSLRSNEIFLPVDLGAIPATLFESELFGYARGAFTDANRDKPGKFEMASEGTLFLDEIGNLSPDLQVKLLGVLQQRTVHRLGETKARPIDFRLISATNADLGDLIAKKIFREDLFYRIRTMEIALPPLRERAEDIPFLAGMMLDEFRQKYARTDLEFHASAMDALKNYHWPGNIRELRHQLEKAVILNDSGTLTGRDFGRGYSTTGNRRSETLNLEQNEKQLIVKAIEKSDWNLTRAAAELGINRSTLYDKIKKYEIRQF
jgi:DNA-binding NtrC family response regulator